MSKRLRTIAGAAAIGVALLLMGGAAGARDTSFAQVERGRYLVFAGDCGACHTADDGKQFAGGRAVPTPFGTIYSTNITPDPDTGIGNWSDSDFWKSMHEGVARGGRHLYPAFPYPWFTKLSREDVAAIKSYLDSIEPVRQRNRDPDLPWPLSWRPGMAVWNAMFFKPGTYQPAADKNEQWNRGAYLVEGPGHCSACHSPKNWLGSVEKSKAFEGGMGEGWFASNLRGNKHEGLGAWSADDIAKYLTTGANDRARAMGPMAEVVEHSTMHLTDDDARAIAAYLKDLGGTNTDHTSAPTNDAAAMQRGRLLYADQCAGCHMQQGEGIANVFPPLKASSAVHAHDPTSLARLVLEGAVSAKTTAKPEGFAMPAFETKLSDAEIADLLTYIRASWGNQADAVQADKIASVRDDLAKGK